jgi:hypothetical protein
MAAGTIAQLTATGEVAPYLLHIAVAAPFLFLLGRVPETSRSQESTPPSLRPPIDRRFRLLLLVAAPWIFAAAAIGYGYLPILLAGSTQGWGLAYATLLTVIALTTAALVQPLAKGVVGRSGGRGLAPALSILATGLLICGAAESARSPALGVLANVVLGAGIGVGLVCGLVEAQRSARPGNLAALTGAFYVSAYTGFLIPLPMAALTPPLSSLAILAGLGALAALCSLVVAVSFRSSSPGKLTVTLAPTGPTDTGVRP